MRAITLKWQPITEEFNLPSFEEVDVKDYREYYEHMECSLFDVVSIDYMGKPVSIYIDDEVAELLTAGSVLRLVVWRHPGIRVGGATGATVPAVSPALEPPRVLLVKHTVVVVVG